MPQLRIRHFAARYRPLICMVRSWFTVLAILTAPWSHAHAQSVGSWNSLGPTGGTVLSLLQIPSLPTVLYAGTLQNGVFVSPDSGGTWVAANNGLPATAGSAARSVRALVSDGQYLYAATDAGIFYAAVAMQAGDVPTWTPMALTNSATPIALLAVDPATGTLLAAGTGAGMADAPVVYSMVIPPLATPATSWVASALPSGTEGSVVSSMAVVPSTGATPATVMVGAGVRVFGASVATAVALSWFDEDPQAQFAALGAVETLAYSTDFSQAYACSGGQLFQATDPRNLGGPNAWYGYAITQMASNALSCSAIASGPGLLAIATNLGVYAWKGDFTLSGAMNIGATKPLPVSPPTNALLFTAGGTPTTLYVGGGFGVSSQPVATLASTSAWAGNNGPASVSAGGSNSRLNNASVSDIVVMGTVLYAAIASEQYADVMSSTDGGATWASSGLSAVLGAVVSIPALAVDATNHVVYAGTDQGLYALTGGSWVRVSSARISSVVSMVRDAGILYVGTDAGVFSLALGPAPASVVAASAGLTTVRVTALHAAAGKLYAGTNDPNASISSVSVAASVTSGAPVWSDYATGAVGSQGRRIYSLAVAGTKLLAATRGESVFIAEQGGAWVAANDGLPGPNEVMTSLISDGTNVYLASANNGVFVASLASLSPLWMPSWAPFSGTADHALPGLEVHQLRSSGTLLYAATSGGLAAYDGIVPITTPPVPPTTPPAASQDSGGGAADAWSLLGLALLLGMLAAMRRSGRRPH